MKQIIIILVSVLFTTGLARAEQQGQEESSIWNLQEIVVTATKTPHLLNDVPVETIVVTKEDIEKMNAQNVMDVLGNIAGINVSVHDDVFGTYTWRANMRGLSFNNGYGLILIDGQRVLGSGQSGGMGEYGIGLNQIPLDTIEKIEIVKGPGSALYGSDAMAGVVNIITKKAPKKATASAGVTYGWYKIKEKVKNGVVTKPSDNNQSRNISRTHVSFGDRVSDSIGYLIHYNYESAEDTGQSPIKSDRHFFMGKLNANVSSKTDISLKTELGKYEKADYREEDSYRISAGVDFYPSYKHLFSLKGYRYVWDFTHGYPGYSYGYKHGDIGYNQAEIQHTWYANDWNTLTTGVEIQKQAIDYIIENPDNSIVNVEKDVDTLSLYVQDEFTLSESLTLIGGARYDHHSDFGSEINPKLSLMYRFSVDTIFRASVGRAFKSPTIRELYYDAPYKHGSFYCKSNPDLKPEIAIGYSAGMEKWLFNRSVWLNIGYFRNDVEDMVTREDTGTTYNGLPLKEYKNVENAWTQGVEFMGKMYLTEGLSASLSYTYTDSENEETGNALTYIPAHSLTLSSAYELKKYGWGTSTAVSYFGKQYTNSANTSQIDEHAVVDLKVYKHLSDNAKMSFEADNVFDSDKGDESNFRSGRTFIVKLDVSY